MPKFQSVDEYIAATEGWKQDILRHYRAVVREAAPETDEAIKWAQPVFSDHGPAVYLRAFKNHVNLGFWRGASLNDPDGRIRTGGDKMGHIKITEEDRPPDAYVAALVREAVELNRTEGDPSKG